MHALRIPFAVSLLLGAVLVAPSAGAATTAPLSSIAALPRPAALKLPEATTTVPGLSIKEKEGYKHSKWYDVNAATGRGYCLAQFEGGSRWMSSTGASDKSDAQDLDLDRLVEKDGKAILERTVVHFDPGYGTVVATGRSHVELHELARNPSGVVVWGYRDGSSVVVLARNVERGLDSRKLSEEGTFPFASSDGCPYAGARLDARKPDAGSFVQLTGALAPVGTGKDKVFPRFTVDASVSRVARDPEPLLAIRVRMHD